MDEDMDRRTSPFGIPQRYLTVLLTFLSTSVCYIERVGFSVAYTSTATKFGVDQATKGWVLSSFYYGYASSQIPGGWIAQKFGGRRVLLFSFILWSVVCLLTPTDSNSIAFLIVIRLLVGVAQGFIFPSIHTVLAQWIPPHERSRSVSLTTSGMYFGAAVAMLLLPGFVASYGPRSVFYIVSAMGIAWVFLWIRFSTDPPGGVTSFPQHANLDRSLKHSNSGPASEENGADPARDPAIRSKSDLEHGKGRRGSRDHSIPWTSMMLCLPVWAIVANNFTFHYALYVLMNWLPTYFDQGLSASLHTMGFSKMLPYLVMFVFSNVGGVVADHLITRRVFSVTTTRKILNTAGFVSSAAALMTMPMLDSVSGAVLCSSVSLGACALARAGFAVNHMDIAPRYAGIVMGLSNTAGTVAGVVGVAATGFILEASDGGIADQSSWFFVFATPALLCVVSAVIFCLFATGERIFE